MGTKKDLPKDRKRRLHEPVYYPIEHRTGVRDPFSSKPVSKLRTFGDYRKLATALITDNNETPIEQNFSKLSKLYSHSVHAFCNAVDVIKYSRKAGGFIISEAFFEGTYQPIEVEQPFLLYCFQLWEYMGRLTNWSEKLYGVLTWPQNPKSTAFDAAGLSALEAMNSFSESIANYSYVFIRDLFLEQTGSYEEKVEWMWALGPSSIGWQTLLDDERFKMMVVASPESIRYLTFLREELKLKVPTSDWSDSSIKREFNSLLCQIGYEYQQANRLCKEKSATPILQDEWITVTEAAALAHVKPGTISRSVNEGKIEYNGKKGPERRLKKSSLLLWIDKRNVRERRKGYNEYNRMLDQIPDKH